MEFLQEKRKLVNTSRDRKAYYPCDCAARKHVVEGPGEIFQDHHWAEFIPEKVKGESFSDGIQPASNQHVEVLILTENLMYPKRRFFFSELLRKFFEKKPDISYSVRSALGCIPRNDSISNVGYQAYQTCYRHNIKRIIQEVKPDVIVTVGTAIESMFTAGSEKDTSYSKSFKMDDTKFFSNHPDDRWFWSSEHQCRVYPVPANYTWLSWNMPKGKGFKKKTHQMEELESSHYVLDVWEKHWTRSQLKEACKYVETKQKEDQIWVNRSVKDLEFVKVEDPNRFIEDLIQDSSRKVIALDTETGGFDFLEDHLFNISLATDEKTGYFLMMDQIDPNVLIRLFDCQDKVFVFHNAAFDLKFLRANKVPNARCDFDTILASHSVNENSPNSLKALTWLYTPYGGYEEELKLWMHKHKIKDMTLLPERLLLPYACVDAIVTLILYHYLNYRLETGDHLNTQNFWNVLHPALPMQIDVEMNGIGVDLQYIEQYSDELVQEKENKVQLLEELYTGPEPKYPFYRDAGFKGEFSVRSPVDVSNLFRSNPEFSIENFQDDRGELFLTKNHLVQRGKEALQAFAAFGDQHTRKIAEILLSLNQINSQISMLGVESFRKKQERLAQNKTLKRARADDLFDFSGLGLTFDQKDLMEEDDIETKADRGYLGSIHDGRLYTGFKLHGTETGRLRGGGGLRSSVNPQNFKKEERFRKIFLSPSGFIPVEVDYVTMEIVLACHLAGHGPMSDALVAGKDIHSVTGVMLMELAGYPISYEEFISRRHEGDKLVKQFRDRAKILNFSILYGAKAPSLAAGMGVEIEEAQQYMEAFDTKYYELAAFRTRCVQIAQTTGVVHTLLGLARRLPQLQYVGTKRKDPTTGRPLNHHNRRSNWINASYNSPVQGSSGQITLASMTDLWKEFKERGWKSKIVGNVHDSIWFDLHEDEIEEAVPIIEYQMTKERYEIPGPDKTGGLPPSKARLKVEMEFGNTYGFGVEGFENWKALRGMEPTEAPRRRRRLPTDG
jgi:DNA polymerase I-like protein with 3'-5' exonuclease and polymerase domains